MTGGRLLGMKEGHEWTFLTNHGHVLVSLWRDPERPLREVALEVGITERAVQRIVADLEAGGYLVRHREGRRNVYELHPEGHLRHELESDCTIGDLLERIEAARAGRENF